MPIYFFRMIELGEHKTVAVVSPNIEEAGRRFRGSCWGSNVVEQIDIENVYALLYEYRNGGIDVEAI